MHENIWKNLNLQWFCVVLLVTCLMLPESDVFTEIMMVKKLFSLNENVTSSKLNNAVTSCGSESCCSSCVFYSNNEEDHLWLKPPMQTQNVQSCDDAGEREALLYFRSIKSSKL